MKRDLLPTEKNIIETLKNDSIERNKQVKQVLDIISNDFKDGGVIFIDGKWGSGKTFFVKQLQHILDCESGLKIINSELSNYGTINIDITEPMMTLYFNAWENDFHMDPLLSMTHKLISASSGYVYQGDVIKKNQSVFIRMSKVIKFVSGGRYDISEFESEKQDTFKVIEVQEEIHSIFNRLVDSILAERANRLVLFIDELDRCKPDYTVRLLERLKHVLNNDKITTIISVNLDELGATVKKLYGETFNHNNYFNKFYDLKIHLDEINRFDYLVQQDSDKLAFLSQYVFNVSVSCSLEYFNLSLREINEYKIYIDKLKSLLKGNSFHIPRKNSVNFIAWIIVPYLIALKISNDSIYKSVTKGRNSSDFTQYYFSDKMMLDLCDYVLSIDNQNSEKEMKLNYEDDFKKIYNFLFTSMHTEFEQIKILNTLFNKNSKDMISRVLKSLK
ncbi:MAG: hypothetical protein JEZ05_04825 [Tenericutes bacterium]|nr:hypothetical protein [Mycoplasmatota bacterium]